MASKNQTTSAQNGNDINANQGAAGGFDKKKRHSMPAQITQPVSATQEMLEKYRCSISSWLNSRRLSEGTRGGEKETDLSKFISCLGRPSMPRVFSVSIEKPKAHKVKILIWSDLTLEDIDKLNNCKRYDQIRQQLAIIFSLSNYKHSLKSEIILDLYYYTLQFARENKFSPEKTSVLFSIMKRIFEVCTETPFGNLDYTFNHFKELLFCHSVNQPPFSVELFTSNDVIKITDYTLNTFFRHFKLYKYVFTPTVRLDLSFHYIGKPETPVPSESFAKDMVSISEEQSEDRQQEEIDPEKLLAQEELTKIVTEFLSKEAKKIEGNVDQHLKAAVDALNAKIDPLVDRGRSISIKGKKK